MKSIKAEIPRMNTTGYSGISGALACLMCLALLWGCQPQDPGSPLANQAPDTRIVVAPMMQDTSFAFITDTTWFTPDSFRVDTVDVDTTIIRHHPDHYVSTSPMFRVQWFGDDPDGQVEGYWVSVDGGQPAWTTRGDSVIAFEASTPDPNTPGRFVSMHVLRVAAQDNEGAIDQTPAERSFEAENFAPRITAFASSFGNNSVVGQGIKFSAEWTDPNPSGALFQLSVNGTVVAPWDPRGAYQFCLTDDPAILEAVDLANVQAVDISRLTLGIDTLKVELKDLGGAMATPVTRVVTVVDTAKPTMASITSVYGLDDYYTDGSVFYAPEVTTNFTMLGRASAYFGEVHSYRYRYRVSPIPDTPQDTVWSAWGEWSAWGAPTFSKRDLLTGVYQFEAECRDFTGAISDAMSYAATIIQPKAMEKTILVVDETRDGNGNPGSADDQQADDFYAAALQGLVDDGWTITHVDVTSRSPDVSSLYVTPLDVYTQQVVLWHADDFAQFYLDDNLRILEEYLDRGGILIVSGWDVMTAFTAEAAPVFSSGFVYKYLRIASAVQVSDRDFKGMSAVPEGYPDVQVDPAKVPGAWNGMLHKTWLLTPAHRAMTVGGFISGSQNPLYQGKSNCVLNKSLVNPWRSMVMGFPLYYMNEAEAREFLTTAVTNLTE